MSRDPLSFRAIRAGAVMYARLERINYRSFDMLRRFAAGFLADALTVQERSRLSLALYEAAGPSSSGQELFDWERRRFEAALPDPPARLLVGGAGTGREVAALVRMGHQVDAFEPAPAMAKLCRDAAADGAVVVQASYEDLARAGLDGADHPAAQLIGRPYDAVLMGWGSLTHVLDPEDRARLMRVAHALTPRGPILASFWARWAEPGGRVYGLGRQAGGWLGRGRGVGQGPAQTEHFQPNAGFGVQFGPADVEALAAVVGRRVVRHNDGGFPHVTFLPEEASAS